MINELGLALWVAVIVALVLVAQHFGAGALPLAGVLLVAGYTIGRLAEGRDAGKR